MSSIAGQDIIDEAAALRGQRRFQDAIDHVEANIQSLDPSTRLVGWLQCFYAAREMGDTSQVKIFAQKCAILEPELPSIQGYL
jgi:hypothetical protein